MILWKAVEYLGLALFIAVVPRLMGPELYGYFAAILSFIGLLTLGTGLGALQAFGRYLPEYAVRGEPERGRDLFSQFFWARLLVTGLLALVSLLILPRVVTVASLPTVVAATAAFLLANLGTIFYQLLYGLNQLGKWRTQESLTRVVLVLLLLALGGGTSLARASLALALVHLMFFLLGLLWTYHHLSFRRSVFRVSSLIGHFRFGLLFFLGSLIMMVLWRGGEILVLTFSESASEVAYFSVANAIALTFAALIGQLSYMFVPSLTGLHLAGEEARGRLLMARLLRYLTVACFGFLFCVHAVGEWIVGTFLGREYLPVIENLELLGLALLPLGLLNVGLCSAVVRAEPLRALRVSVVGLAVFLAGSTLLVPGSGSSGACIAMIAAMSAASLAAYFEFRLSAIVFEGQLWRVAAAGLGALPLILFPVEVGLPEGVVALFLYGVLLFVVGALGREDLRRLRALVRSTGEAPSRV